MKNFIFCFAIACLFATAVAQQRPSHPDALKDIAVKNIPPADEPYNLTQTPNPYVKSYPVEEIIGQTRYDDQSNASIQNRLYYYDDGTLGATWIMGLQDAAFPDRGAGYNFFDGTEWQSFPDSRIEDERCGWPSYAPLSADGEIVVSHTSASGLKISTRDTRGTGDWNYSLLPGPTTDQQLLWPRMITAGADHNTVHVLGLTASSDYGGGPYQGLDGALLYSRSTDGGNTWDPQTIILDGMTSNEYTGFYSDTYAWAEPKGGILAFVHGDSWHDLYIMKSTDGGDTWTKIIIWEHPYPMWSGEVTDTFYCADGAHTIAIDNNDKVHVAFGLNRAYSDGTENYWFPFIDGLAYWNEDMPAFSDDHNALNPYGHPDSELVEDYNLIAWAQDMDNDGEITYVGSGTENIGTYFLGISSMPQMVIDDQNNIFVIYSSVTETYDNTLQNYRHLWGRSSLDGGDTWHAFVHLTDALIHNFDECVYPSVAANSDDNIYMIFQTDNEPGVAVWGDEDPYVDNSIYYMKVNKTKFWPYATDDILTEETVSEVFPNPANDLAFIEIMLQTSTSLKMEVYNLTGQRVLIKQLPETTTGTTRIDIDASDLFPGVYFCRIKAGGSEVVRKLVVD